MYIDRSKEEITSKSKSNLDLQSLPLVPYGRNAAEREQGCEMEQCTSLFFVQAVRYAGLKASVCVLN